ncbi:class I SAM-dependent methyltransferase [Roseivirga sp. BDSF3-8]|uniref:class I SAM-dependent methyltransferase n=1 Tax=Roseivirga sp. BDSF3-8 TaxID=3241598 RepID=UPI00353220C0
MAIYTTEITSDKLPADNPIHQRLLKAYYVAEDRVAGDLLEVGCGEGRGVELLSPKVRTYTALDKITTLIERLSKKYDNVSFRQAVVPPFTGIEDNAYDRVVSFQVIEHIKDDRRFLEEIYRVLKPGGFAIISTPNIRQTLTRNPWHEREYTPEQLKALANGIFDKVEAMGIAGNNKVMQYHELNRRSVRKITRWDVFNLQYRLPAPFLRVPYEILNRMNRNKLKSSDDSLVMSITHKDYYLTEKPDKALDLFYILHKS